MNVEWRPQHNPWAIAMTVTLATFMEVLDTSIANVALPHIAGNLSATFDESTWILTSYLVSNAVVLPVSGWISMRIGRKRFYMACVALFTVSSFACGLAPSLSALIVCRVLQGAGGGGLQPSEQAILADTFPQEKRGMAFAIYGMAVVLAPAIGPTLGGYITDHASWRWIFFINVPVGVTSLVLTNRLVDDPPWVRRGSNARAPIDYVGLGLIVVGLGALQILLDKGERDDWFSSHFITGAALVAAVSLTALVIWEWRQEHPIIELRLLGRRNFGVAAIMMLMLGVVLFGSTVLLPQYLQTVMGYSAQDAGMVLSPGGLVVICLLPLVGRLITKIDPRWLIGFGFFITAVALYHMTSIHPGISFWTAVKFRMFQSVGLAFLFVPITTLAYVGIPPEKNNSVSGLVNLARNVGGGVGISIAQTLLSRRAQLHQTNLVAHVTPFDAPLRSALAGLEHALVAKGVAGAEATRRAYGIVYGQVLQQAGTLAFIDVLWLLAIACACLVPLVTLMHRPPRDAAPAMH
ncbi:MAG TPA: DHA2 family efflux MFS transporter permease subunit [Polyangia bacterium]|nr:DHA2 family efflux MFS transporter permease subunit [Polyangia bacterium]